MHTNLSGKRDSGRKRTTGVVGALCVACGRCIQSCPKRYKKPRVDIEAATGLIARKGRVFASLAPTFAAEFSECSPGQLAAALKRLGFFAASETALGARLAAAETDRLLRGAKAGNRLFISSACPSAAKYIALYKPRFASHIADVASPVLAHTRLLRKWYEDEIGVVSVGPCLAEKLEADASPEIDASITFSELRRCFSLEGIEPECLPPESCAFVPFRAPSGSGFGAGAPAALSAAGLRSVDRLLDGFQPETLEKPVLLSLSACTGGCAGGPGMSAASSGVTQQLRAARYAEEAGSAVPSELLSAGIPLSGALRFPSVCKKQYTREEMREALASVGKYAKRDERNCGSCGYDTCRDFAEAMLKRHAEKTMCVSHMRNLAQKQANGLLRAMPAGVVIVDKSLAVVECNRNFARLMGADAEELYDAAPGLEGVRLERLTDTAKYFADMLAAPDPHHREYDIRERKQILHLTVFPIEKNGIAAGVFEDITVPRAQKDRAVAHAKRIIDRNVSVVQQIAFLLGEHAAETEALLQSMTAAYAGEADGE
jgi:PAS domain-containing protein